MIGHLISCAAVLLQAQHAPQSNVQVIQLPEGYQEWRMTPDYVTGDVYFSALPVAAPLVLQARNGRFKLVTATSEPKEEHAEAVWIPAGYNRQSTVMLGNLVLAPDHVVDMVAPSVLPLEGKLLLASATFEGALYEVVLLVRLGSKHTLLAVTRHTRTVVSVELIVPRGRTLQAVGWTGKNFVLLSSNSEGEQLDFFDEQGGNPSSSTVIPLIRPGSFYDPVNQVVGLAFYRVMAVPSPGVVVTVVGDKLVICTIKSK